VNARMNAQIVQMEIELISPLLLQNRCALLLFHKILQIIKTSQQQREDPTAGAYDPTTEDQQYGNEGQVAEGGEYTQQGYEEESYEAGYEEEEQYQEGGEGKGGGGEGESAGQCGHANGSAQQYGGSKPGTRARTLVPVLDKEELSSNSIARNVEDNNDNNNNEDPEDQIPKNPAKGNKPARSPASGLQARDQA
jgi:hypothetical protein